MPDATTPANPRTERQLALLDRLADHGLTVAAAIARAAEPEAEAAQPDLAALAMAYARVSRAVRMAVLLQMRLGEAQAEAEAVDPVFEASEGRKLRVERIVDRVIREQHDDPEAINSLSLEMTERLDDEDLYGDVMQRPLGELVSLICRDLGLDPDWARRAEEAWAVEERRAAPAGSPFLPTSLAREGGGPSAAEPMVEGAGHGHDPPVRRSARH